ncbi:hypothetical protein ACEPPN_012043 [Leptodophora sp. 'Broadleaf-Isolate-01']
MQRAQGQRSGRSPIRKLPLAATRASPRRRQSNLLGYGIEVVEETIANPPRAPRTPLALRRVQLNNGVDIPMRDALNTSGLASQPIFILESQEIAVPDPESLSNGRGRPRYAIPTTVVRKPVRPVVARRNPIERSWTLFYFDIQELETTWLKKYAKGTSYIYDRLWTCKYCDWESKDLQRHGNTLATTAHLLKVHKMTSAMHSAGVIEIKNNAKGGGGRDRDIL